MFKILSILLVFSMFSACKKNTVELKPLEYTLSYEVITSSGTWFGEYNDSTGKHASTNNSMPSGWKYTYKLKSLPFDMFINATSTCVCSGTATSPDVTINFFSNGTLFKTVTNNWAKGVTSLDFHLQ